MKLSGKLTFNRVALKPIKVPRATKSGIMLPEVSEKEQDSIDNYEDHPSQGIVIGVGPNVTSCKEGDIVLLRNDCHPFGLLDKATVCMVIHEQDILLVREEDGSPE